MVSQPSFARNDRIRDLENYDYKQGTFLGNSGHVRVTVSPEKATVDYVKSSTRVPVTDSHYCALEEIFNCGHRQASRQTGLFP
jgi:hypothetical protein